MNDSINISELRFWRLVQHGLSLHKSKKTTEAAQALAKALELKPDADEVRKVYASVLTALGHNHKAEHCHRQLVLRAPNGVGYSELSHLSATEDRPDLALLYLRRTLICAPDFAPGYIQMSKVSDHGAAHAKRAIALAPDNSAALFAYARWLRTAQNLDTALLTLRRALMSGCADPSLLNNLASVSLQQGQTKAAHYFFQCMTLAHPGQVAAYHALGMSALGLMQLRLAMSTYDRAMVIAPHDGRIKFGASLSYLTAGCWSSAWPLYEARWELETMPPKRPAMRPPATHLAQVNGKTVLLRAEQGFGDTIQFARFAQQLAKHCGRVIVEVPIELVTLLRRVPGIDACVPIGSPLPPHDYECQMMSAPLLLGTTVETLPLAEGYLTADRRRARSWYKRVVKEGKKQTIRKTAKPKMPLVGLVWRGASYHVNDSDRSISLTTLVRHLPPGFTYVSLQQGFQPGERIKAAPAAIKDFGPQLVNFDETAALVCHLNLVITVDTSVAHLSGAMGQRTWLLLPYRPDWRWLATRQDSPWFANMRIYRQTRPGDWRHVLRRVGADLKRQLRNAR
ncbi:MAG: hypothetical protein VXY54_07350 [Pseudomonadota bacterium]|nr:hypothetical protein [Pseudomonadota bacterium]